MSTVDDRLNREQIKAMIEHALDAAGTQTFLVLVHELFNEKADQLEAIAGLRTATLVDKTINEYRLTARALKVLT
jgi:predicted branched-subunit amino acid permease